MRGFIRSIPVAIVGAFLVSGCSENEKSIYRETNLDGGTAIVTDAKQRLVVNVPNYRNTTNKQPTRIVCAEPSPDVAQAMSDAIKLSASFDASKIAAGAAGPTEKTVAAEFQRSTAAQVAQLGERLATIQLLRDKMYRACEAYANGATGPTGYTLMLARMDKTMTTLLSNEMAAGAFGRALAVIGTQASTGGVDPAKLLEAQNELKAGVADLEKAVALPATKEEETAARNKAITDAKGKISAAANKLVLLEFQTARTAAGATGASAPGAIAGYAGSGGANSIVQIHRTYMDDDGTEPLLDACVTAMDGIKVADADANSIADARRQLDQIRSAISQLNLSLKMEMFSKSDRAKTEAAREDLQKQQNAAESAYNNRLFEAFLKSGGPFAAFCHSLVLSDNSPFMAKRIAAKKALREIDATQQSPVEVKERMCAELRTIEKPSEETTATITKLCGLDVTASASGKAAADKKAEEEKKKAAEKAAAEKAAAEKREAEKKAEEAKKKGEAPPATAPKN